METPSSEPEPKPLLVASNDTDEPLPLGEATTVAEGAPFVVIFSVQALALFFLSSILIRGILKHEKLKQQVETIYMASAFLSGICVAVFVIPTQILAYLSEDFLPPWVCRSCQYFNHVAITASIYSQVILASYICSNGPLGLHVTSRQAKFHTISVWVLSALYAIRAPILCDLVIITGKRSDGGIYRMAVCTGNRDDHDLFRIYRVFLIVDLVLLFILPLLWIIGCYATVLIFTARNPDGCADRANCRKQIFIYACMCSFYGIFEGPVTGVAFAMNVCDYMFEEAIFVLPASFAWSFTNGIADAIINIILDPLMREAATTTIRGWLRCGKKETKPLQVISK